MSAAAAWRCCLAAGLIAFGCSYGFGRIPGLHPCGDTAGLGAIIAFEFARTPADLAALFGAEPCRSTLASAQRTGLWLDAMGFIPSYTAFLCFAARATGDLRRRWVIPLLIAAGVADEIEGLVLSTILRGLPGSPALLHALPWPVHIKFILLAFGTALLGMMIGAGRPQLAIAIAAIVAISGAALFAFVHLLLDPALMMAGFTLAWSTLLLVAAIGAVWPRLLAPRPPTPAVPSA